MRIYLASSWRNQHYPVVLETLRAAGHDVYDFRNSGPGEQPFKWKFVDKDYTEWDPVTYREKLGSPLAARQFANDMRAMESCDCCVMVLPCGRSAHTEAGWFAGRGRKVIALILEKQEPELMYRLFDQVACSLDELLDMLSLK